MSELDKRNDSADAELREKFVSLRKDVAQQMPSYSATVAAARSSVSRHRPWAVSQIVALAASLVLVLGVSLLVLRPDDDGSGFAVTLEITDSRWNQPTDFLLQLPGGELLGTVPKLTILESTFPLTPDIRSLEERRNRS